MDRKEETPAEGIARFLEGKKAEDVLIIDMRGRSPYYDDAIFATAPGHRALEAFASDVQDYFEMRSISVKKPEGTADSGWVLVDAGDVVVHLFVRDKRESLKLEDVLTGKETPRS